MNIHDLSATDLLRLYRRRELSPVEVTEDALTRIERFNPVINAFLIVDREGALKAARGSEERWAKGEPRGQVDGVPATVKDNVVMAGWPCRRGSLVSDTSEMAYDAPSVARLRENGAVLLGKTTLPEFGWIGACHSPLTGVTRNPWDLDRTPGGSSGGAAAAALLNLGALHVGTDAAGSVRIPAAFTGVFAIKPTYGRVPAFPASPFSTLAHVGPITRTVTDAALMLNVIAMPDERDMTAWNSLPPDFRIGLSDGVKGLRIAWSRRLGYVQKVDPEIAAATAAAAQRFADLGAHVEEADPGLPDCADTIRVLWQSVSATILDGIPKARHKDMDPGFVRMAERGRRYTLGDYLAAFAKRAELANTMARFHQKFDLLLTPQMPTPALGVGLEAPASGGFGDEWIEWSPFTYPFNLTQQPAASGPCGFTSDGLPIGLQIVGAARADALVLRAARAFESLAPFPTISAPRMHSDATTHA